MQSNIRQIMLYTSKFYPRNIEQKYILETLCAFLAFPYTVFLAFDHRNLPIQNVLN